MTAAGVSFIAYLVAGLTQSVWISLPVAIVLMLIVIFVIRGRFSTVDQR